MIPGSANALLLGSAAGGYTISRSIRLNASDSAFLSRTPASAGNRKTWTWAGWVKRSNLTAQQTFWSVGNTGTNRSSVLFDTSARIRFFNYAGSVNVDLVTTPIYGDASAWYHFVIAVDTTQGTASNRIKLYANGVQVTAFSTSTYPSSSQDLVFNSAIAHGIGRGEQSGGEYFSGYLADVHFIDGQALDPTSFGEFDDNGIWQPIEYNGTYGTNGFHLDFSDNSATTAAALGADSSGNGNNWTPNNLTAGPAVISNSWSGYFDGSGDYLSVPHASALDLWVGDFTVECWAWLNGNQGNNVGLVNKAPNNASPGWSPGWAFQIYSNALTVNTPADNRLFSTGVTIPTYSWVHCVLVKSGNTVSIFQNGTRTGTITNSNSYSNTSDAITVGTNRYLPGDKFNGYISNLRLVKGTAVYDPSQSSITVPTSPLTAIPNTSLLTCQSSAFVDNSTNNFTITANGDARVDFRSPFEEPVNTDSLVDVPTNGSEPDTGVGGEVRGNYCTWNPLNGSGALADGNLSFTSSASVHKRIGTIGVASGKWYFEAVCTAQATQNQGVGIGNINAATDSLGIGSTTNSWALICESGSANGWLYHNQSVAADIGNVNVNDVMMIAYDADSGKLWFGVNGSWYNSGNPAAGTNASFTSVSGSAMFPAVSGGQTTPGTIVANFGQRPWAYQAPAGFKALCTANLPAPTIEDGSTAMDVVTYTGNGSTQTISGLGFSPDLVWVKGRVGILNHVLADTVRGANLKLASNTTGAEAGTDNGTVSAFNSDGFTVAMGGGTYPGYETNRSGDPYVGWAWDAGSSTVTNNDGSISSQVRANPSAGFSVVTYTGNGTGGATVGHGLGAKPFLRIIKRRDATSTFGWMTFHESAPTSFFTLNTTAAATPASEPAPTSTVFSLPTDVNSNANNGTYVAYCFAPVEGYSAFGSYTGNGSADGPFVYTGFRPRYILIKNSTYAGQAWWILDTARDDANVADNYLQANSSNAEGTFTVGDILSNGFKIRTTDIALNGSTHTIIFAAFAENPFSLARAR